MIRESLRRFGELDESLGLCVPMPLQCVGGSYGASNDKTWVRVRRAAAGRLGLAARNDHYRFDRAAGEKRSSSLNNLRLQQQQDIAKVLMML